MAAPAIRTGIAILPILLHEQGVVRAKVAPEVVVILQCEVVHRLQVAGLTLLAVVVVEIVGEEFLSAGPPQVAAVVEAIPVVVVAAAVAVDGNRPIV